MEEFMETPDDYLSYRDGRLKSDLGYARARRSTVEQDLQRRELSNFSAAAPGAQFPMAIRVTS